ncbi:MAG: GNAT family N-acetyltransferase [Bacteroidetes bacterium]|nr:GNAT family N-acetyltransferase [Bacteroidota bacterium]
MNNSTIPAIRPAKPEDALLIRDFQLEMAWETEKIRLDGEITLKGVHAVFADPSKGRYYIAMIQKTIAGSLLVTPEWSDWRNRQILWIQSVFVLPEYRKQGIFKALYKNLLKEVMEDETVGGIRLYVDKTNLLAQKVYHQLGMDGEHYKVFEWMK